MSNTTMSPEVGRKAVMDELLASGFGTADYVAQFEEYMKVYDPRAVPVLLGVIANMVEIEKRNLPQLVHDSPPDGVELFYHDFPESDIRLLYHQMHSLTIPCPWQYYVRDSQSQPLQDKPIVEGYDPDEDEWHVVTVYVARPGDILRINGKYTIRLPFGPEEPNGVLRRLSSA
ncbi:hypothetical protein MIND_01229300 [Mycena indigotica]|uniref:Uncharacterized protein n=1 Tax=Mycena indigotica TaxID=2126181 RepID=A0A8H6S3I5_9AGAR|nr:uncharacterized protein MIND_01229300 [Mycena indigotica]KAF7292033.1 hypothetical protein MIND_01229300 [Mycena indigotica]